MTARDVCGSSFINFGQCSQHLQTSLLYKKHIYRMAPPENELKKNSSRAQVWEDVPYDMIVLSYVRLFDSRWQPTLIPRKRGSQNKTGARSAKTRDGRKMAILSI